MAKLLYGWGKKKYAREREKRWNKTGVNGKIPRNKET